VGSGKGVVPLDIIFFLQNGAFWRVLKGFPNNAQLVLQIPCCCSFLDLRVVKKQRSTTTGTVSAIAGTSSIATAGLSCFKYMPRKRSQ